MNIAVWIGFVVLLVYVGFPLRKEENRTKKELYRSIIQLLIVIGMFIAVSGFQLHIIYVSIVGVLLLFLAEDIFYKRKILFTVIVLFILIVSSVYFVFRGSASTVLNHIENHPETTSLYVAEDGDVIIDYETDEVRPLASVVKIVIAITYAEAAEEGSIDPEERVEIAELDKYYTRGTDGGAHKVWLQSVDIQDGTVALHDVVKGMVTNSSNANTDYMLDLLGIDRVNDVMESLELPMHEPIYPLVGGLYVSYSLDEELSVDEKVEELEEMSMDEYRKRAIAMHEKMKDGTLPMDEDLDLPLKLRRVWSDRLPGAPANVYGDLLGRIAHDGFTDEMNVLLRDLMEWPLQLYPHISKHFEHHGSKGGSTGFILNDASYAELPDGTDIEMVILMDDLSQFQQIYMEQSFGKFKAKMLLDEDFRKKVKERLE